MLWTFHPFEHVHRDIGMVGQELERDDDFQFEFWSCSSTCRSLLFQDPCAPGQCGSDHKSHRPSCRSFILFKAFVLHEAAQCGCPRPNPMSSSSQTSDTSALNFLLPFSISFQLYFGLWGTSGQVLHSAPFGAWRRQPNEVRSFRSK